MIVQDNVINASCEDIVYELQRQLHINKIPYLHKIQDSGKNIMITCPYHGNGQERRPSAGIRKIDGLFHCFACGQAHTLPEVISYCFGKDDMFGRWGMKWILKNFSTVQVEERKDVEIDLARNNISNKSDVLDSSDSNKSNYVTEEELDSYRYYHEYWTKRGITDENIIELFDLGYDKRTNCITFPVRDIDGNCLFVARRNVETKWFNYPKDVEKPLYGLFEFKSVLEATHELPYQINTYGAVKSVNLDKLYITESMIDCILLWQAGKYTVALNGTGSTEQIETLKKLPIRHYVLATDNDEAGQRARSKLRNALPNKLITEIDFPDNIKDIGECTKEQIQNIDRWEVF